MNKTKRNRLEKIQAQIESLIYEIDEIRDEEDEAYNNLPEGIQDSEKGEDMYDNISDLEEISMSLCDVTEIIQNIIER